MSQQESSKRTQIINIALGLAVALLIGINAWSAMHDSSDQTHVMTGKPAPDFTLKQTGEAQALSLSQYKGKVVLLDFWALYCKPCLKQMPILEEVQRSFQGQPFTVISVNSDHHLTPGRNERIHNLVRDGGFSFPIVLDTGQTIKDYQISKIPAFFLIDAEGVIQEAHSGLSSKRELSDAIARLLNPSEKP